MRAANIERVKRRMLQQAVAENLDVIRGVPPRALRSGTRLWRLWLRRSMFVLLPLTLAGSSYIIANGNGRSPAVSPMSMLPLGSTIQTPIRTQQAALVAPDALDTPERMTSSAFPLSVRR